MFQIRFCVLFNKTLVLAFGLFFIFFLINASIPFYIFVEDNEII